MIVSQAFCFKLFFVLFFGVCEGKPITGNSKSDAFFYLASFGYIDAPKNENTAQLMTDSALTKAIRGFQEFAGLNVTGTLDAKTVELMNTPRCGIRDNVGPSSNARRKKRYAHQGSRWNKRDLTYRITSYPSTSRLKKRDVDDQVKKAFQLWENATNLRFTRKKSGSVHIEIRFERREHGDGDPFDGAGGTLAHAFFPIYGGDAHFDDDEYWTIDDFRGTNLLQTAAHEFGHSLGLSHSDVRAALMAPFYRGYEPNLELHSDDIKGIQAIYGEKDKGTPTKRPVRPTSRPGRPSNDNDLCEDGGRVDTIFSDDDGNFYAFKGSYYYLLTDDSIADGYPRRIGDDWPGLPNNIDAAVTWPSNGYTYFFKGRLYYRFDVNKNPSEGYPKTIEDKFPGIPDDVDAAFVWGGNGKIYFFKGDQYWRFDPKKKIPVSDAYPRDIRNWDLPPGISAATKWKNNYSYFFHGTKYYRFNDRKFTLDKGDPEFPRPSGPWWFGCKADEFTSKALRRGESLVVTNGYDEADDIMLDASPSDSDYYDYK